VKLALNGSRPVEFLNRMGGNVPSHEEVLRFVQELARREDWSKKLPTGKLRKRSAWQCLNKDKRG